MQTAVSQSLGEENVQRQSETVTAEPFANTDGQEESATNYLNVPAPIKPLRKDQVYVFEIACNNCSLGITLGVGRHDLTNWQSTIYGINGMIYHRKPNGDYFQIEEIASLENSGLNRGDEVLSINDCVLEKYSLEDVAILLEEATISGQVKLTITRPKRLHFRTTNQENNRLQMTFSYSEPYNIDLVKKEEKTNLGIGLVGGIDAPLGAIGFFIKTIQPNGLIAEDGRLKKGDEILSLNGVTLQGLTHSQAVKFFKMLPVGSVRLTVRSLHVASTHNSDDLSVQQVSPEEQMASNDSCIYGDTIFTHMSCQKKSNKLDDGAHAFCSHSETAHVVESDKETSVSKNFLEMSSETRDFTNCLPSPPPSPVLYETDTWLQNVMETDATANWLTDFPDNLLLHNESFTTNATKLVVGKGTNNAKVFEHVNMSKHCDDSRNHNEPPTNEYQVFTKNCSGETPSCKEVVKIRENIESQLSDEHEAADNYYVEPPDEFICTGSIYIADDYDSEEELSERKADNKTDCLKAEYKTTDNERHFSNTKIQSLAETLYSSSILKKEEDKREKTDFDCQFMPTVVSSADKNEHFFGNNEEGAELQHLHLAKSVADDWMLLANSPPTHVVSLISETKAGTAMSCADNLPSYLSESSIAKIVVHPLKGEQAAFNVDSIFTPSIDANFENFSQSHASFSENSSDPLPPPLPASAPPSDFNLQSHLQCEMINYINDPRDPIMPSELFFPSAIPLVDSLCSSSSTDLADCEVSKSPALDNSLTFVSSSLGIDDTNSDEFSINFDVSASKDILQKEKKGVLANNFANSLTNDNDENSSSYEIYNGKSFEVNENRSSQHTRMIIGVTPEGTVSGSTETVDPGVANNDSSVQSAEQIQRIAQNFLFASLTESPQPLSNYVGTSKDRCFGNSEFCEGSTCDGQNTRLHHPTRVSSDFTEFSTFSSLPVVAGSFTASKKSLSKDQTVTNVLREYYANEDRTKEELDRTKPKRPLIAQALLPKTKRSGSSILHTQDVTIRPNLFNKLNSDSNCSTKNLIKHPHECMLSNSDESGVLSSNDTKTNVSYMNNVSTKREFDRCFRNSDNDTASHYSPKPFKTQSLRASDQPKSSMIEFRENNENSPAVKQISEELTSINNGNNCIETAKTTERNEVCDNVKDNFNENFASSNAFVDSVQSPSNKNVISYMTKNKTRKDNENEASAKEKLLLSTNESEMSEFVESKNITMASSAAFFRSLECSSKHDSGQSQQSIHSAPSDFKTSNSNETRLKRSTVIRSVLSTDSALPMENKVLESSTLCKENSNERNNSINFKGNVFNDDKIKDSNKGRPVKIYKQMEPIEKLDNKPVYHLAKNVPSADENKISSTSRYKLKNDLKSDASMIPLEVITNKEREIPSHDNLNDKTSSSLKVNKDSAWVDGSGVELINVMEAKAYFESLKSSSSPICRSNTAPQKELKGDKSSALTITEETATESKETANNFQTDVDKSFFEAKLSLRKNSAQTISNMRSTLPMQRYLPVSGEGIRSTFYNSLVPTLKPALKPNIMTDRDDNEISQEMTRSKPPSVNKQQADASSINLQLDDKQNDEYEDQKKTVENLISKYATMLPASKGKFPEVLKREIPIRHESTGQGRFQYKDVGTLAAEVKEMIGPLTATDAEKLKESETTSTSSLVATSGLTTSSISGCNKSKKWKQFIADYSELK